MGVESNMSEEKNENRDCLQKRSVVIDLNKNNMA